MTRSTAVSDIIALRIRAIRERAKTSEASLARRSGLGSARLRMIEKGDPGTTLSELELIAEVLNVAVFELMVNDSSDSARQSTAHSRPAGREIVTETTFSATARTPAGR